MTPHEMENVETLATGIEKTGSSLEGTALLEPMTAEDLDELAGAVSVLRDDQLKTALEQTDLLHAAVDKILTAEAFKRSNNNVTAAATLLGVNRTSLNYRLIKYKLRVGKLWGSKGAKSHNEALAAGTTKVAASE
jgi:DNA-binding NtrC family response regulator